jgi:hypothetical protein
MGCLGSLQGKKSLERRFLKVLCAKRNKLLVNRSSESGPKTTGSRIALTFRTWSWVNFLKEYFMFRKNLIIGSVVPVLLLVLFALTGCISPTDGAPGGIGRAQLSGAVSAEQLTESFAIHDVVQLDSGTTGTTVVGLVPAGKTLIIAGTVGIGPAKPLIVNGRVEIKAKATFSTVLGTLAKESNGSIYTGGELVLAPQYYDYPIITARTAFEAGAILSLPGAAAATINEFFGKPGINNIKNNTLTLTGSDVTTLANWTGAKKLLLEHNAALNLTGFDLSAETLGKLEIGKNVTVTIPAGGAVKAQATSANVTITAGGKIILPSATTGHVDLQGKIIVNGGALSANGTSAAVTTTPIPGDVDLSKGYLTVENAANTVTITLPDASVTIGGIIASDNLTIAGPAASAVITVGSITGATGKVLTLPGVTVEAGEIGLPAGILTIAGPAGAPAATLKPAKVSGAANGELTFTGTNIALAGPIDLSAIITIPDLLNLGQTTDQLAQLAKITGGTVKVTPAITFNGAAASDTVFSTAIVGAADSTITTSSTFKEGLTSAGKVLSAGAPGGIIITLGKDSVFTGGLDVQGTGGVTIAGSGRLALTAALTAGGPVTFTGGNVTLAAAANTLSSTVLTVGPRTTVTAGGIIFSEGVYTAAGVITIAAATNVISGAAATDTLALGSNDPATAKLLTLAGGASTGTFTLTGSGTATLSGTGNGAIVVTPATAAAILTVGAAAEIKLGDGIIALGYARTFPGSLALTNGAKLSGFTYSKGPSATYTLQSTTAAYQPSFTTNTNGGQSVLGKYYTDGVMITAGTGAYTDDPTTTPPTLGTITGNGTSYTAAAIHGGIITKNSDVAQ